MGYCAAPGPLLAHSLTALALTLGGSDEQKTRWLPKLASGEVVGSVAFAEEDDRWQPDQWALSQSDGRLTGVKRHVLFPSDADMFLVGLAGGDLAIVARDVPGVTTREWDGVDRTRRLGALHLEDAACDILPGGMAVAERVRDAGLILIAADAYGGAHRSVELTVDYANERVQFGKTIAHFQGVKHQIADAAAEVEPSRSLVWYAAYAFDHRPDEAPRLAAVAKSHLADRYVDASRTMVMLHGGIGYTWEFHCQLWLKRAMFDRNYLGSPSLHRERAAQLAGW
jgi:alkylation response protein AidB-like acyl-CoA dehydrogenase